MIVFTLRDNLRGSHLTQCSQVPGQDSGEWPLPLIKRHASHMMIFTVRFRDNLHLIHGTYKPNGDIVLTGIVCSCLGQSDMLMSSLVS